MNTTTWKWVGALAVGGALLGIVSGCASRECSSQSDCGIGTVCTGDGACVEARGGSSLMQRGTGPRNVDGVNRGGGGNGGGAGGPAAGGGAPATGLPSLTGTGVMNGPLGPVTTTDAPVALSSDDFLLTIRAPAYTADAVIFIGDNSGGTTSVRDLVTTPGTHTSVSGDFDAPFWGQACTQNEEDSNNHYDETADTELTVSEPDSQGNFNVEVHQHNMSTDVTASLVINGCD